MRWIRLMLLALPFAIAGALTGLMLSAEQFHWHGQRIAGFCFLFGAPWGWLLDRAWIPFPHNQVALHLVWYAGVLWIPAALYSTSLWLLLARIPKWLSRRGP